MAPATARANSDTYNFAETAGRAFTKKSCINWLADGFKVSANDDDLTDYYDNVRKAVLDEMCLCLQSVVEENKNPWTGDVTKERFKNACITLGEKPKSTSDYEVIRKYKGIRFTDFEWIYICATMVKTIKKSATFMKASRGNKRPRSDNNNDDNNDKDQDPTISYDHKIYCNPKGILTSQFFLRAGLLTDLSRPPSGRVPIKALRFAKWWKLAKSHSPINAITHAVVGHDRIGRDSSERTEDWVHVTDDEIFQLSVWQMLDMKVKIEFWVKNEDTEMTGDEDGNEHPPCDVNNGDHQEDDDEEQDVKKEPVVKEEEIDID